MRLSVKVIPKSSRECIAGWLGETLKICVKAPAEKSKANQAVIKLMAKALIISQASVAIVKGQTTARKVIEIADLSDKIIYERLKIFTNK